MDAILDPTQPNRFHDLLSISFSITFNERNDDDDDDDDDEESAMSPHVSFCRANMSRMLDSWIKGQMLSVQPRKQRHQGPGAKNSTSFNCICNYTQL